MDNLVKNIVLTPLNALYGISPKMALSILFRLKLGYSINWENPRTYNEKLQWIKLYDRNPLMAICCDKYEVRNYVRACGYERHLNGLLWEGANPDELPFEDLPERFVIKATHGSTFNIICKDKSSFDVKAARSQLRRWLNADFLPCYGEWFYGQLPPRLIVEDYLEDASGQLLDYKVFCFGGVPRIVRVDSGRFVDHKADYFDERWRHLDNVSNVYGRSPQRFERPACLDEMLDVASVLAAPFKHVRVDFYVIEGKLVFGELTFTNGAGFERLYPFEFDVLMGNWIDLK